MVVATRTADAETVEFPHVMYESTVYAPDPQTGCPQGSDPVLKPTACDPDPHADMCRWLDKKVKAVNASRQKLIEPAIDAARAAAITEWRAARKDLGPIPKEEAKLKAYRESLYARVTKASQQAQLPPIAALDGQLEKTRPQVMATINAIRDTMARALKASSQFEGYHYMIDKILSCKLTLIHDYSSINLNANISRTHANASVPKVGEAALNQKDVQLVSHQSCADHTGEDEGFVIKVNPLEQTTFECRMALSPTIWAACSENPPGAACVMAIFHEFGHTFNSCNFMTLNQSVREIKSRAQAAASSSKADQAELAAIHVLESQSAGFAKRLVDATTSCLEGLSSPKDPITNSCSPTPGVLPEHEARCGWSAVPGYPSQWLEAEADLWGATGMAQWMTERVKSKDERARLVYDTWAEFCADAAELKNDKMGWPPDLLDDSKALNDEPAAKKTAATGPGDKSGLTIVDSNAQPVDACKSRPAKGTLPAEPWGDPHQPWGLRANRNFMRNLDIRKALGCDLSDKRIPLTCSPLGRSVVPKK